MLDFPVTSWRVGIPAMKLPFSGILCCHPLSFGCFPSLAMALAPNSGWALLKPKINFSAPKFNYIWPLAISAFFVGNGEWPIISDRHPKHPTFSTQLSLVSKERRSLEVLKSWQVGSVVWSDRAWCLGISWHRVTGHDGFVEDAAVKTPTILSHPEPPLALNHPSPPSTISHFICPTKVVLSTVPFGLVCHA